MIKNIAILVTALMTTNNEDNKSHEFNKTYLHKKKYIPTQKNQKKNKKTLFSYKPTP